MLKRLFSYLSLVLLIACAKEAVDLKPAGKAKLDLKGGIVEGELCVKFDEETTEKIEAGDFASTKAAAVSTLGEVTLTRVFPDAGEFEPRTRAAGLHRWYKVTFSEEMSSTKAATELLSAEGVEIDELQKSFPGLSFTRVSYCAGIITLHK